jgi:hypothetical protein
MIPLNLFLAVINAGLFLATGEWICFVVGLVCALTVMMAHTLEEDEIE